MPSPGRAEDLVGLPSPDLALPSSEGGTFALRSRIGRGPLVLFFYIHNGTPG
jgi:peroxiredoxin